MPNLWTGQLNFAATPLVLAEVCERYGAYEQAIEFTSLGLPPKAGEHPSRQNHRLQQLFDIAPALCR